MIKIGINGFNRIVKMIIYLTIKNSNSNIKIVGINIKNEKLIDIDNLIYILKYDTIHRLPKINIIKNNNNIIINNKHIIRITNEKKNFKWDKINAKYIIETEKKNENNLYNHIKSGAKKVIFTYYPKNKKIPIFILGLNHKLINKDNNIISSSSSSINCLAIILKVLHKEFIINECLATNIKSLNNKLTIIDDLNLKNKNIIKCRSFLNNIIPIKNKFKKKINLIIPELKNKIKGLDLIVPNINSSLIDLNIKINKSTSYKDVKNIIKFYSKNELSGILGYNKKKLISSDFLDDIRISIFDSKRSTMLNKKFLKIISWYNNEISYSKKLIDLIKYIEYNII
ncbi:MAG: type I glyceraldehyde-3-phosphate dehydrogenase [Candidatus Shikimatogenerans bostrichidophilus]|nr:MAG: type I glyceraldehyde-3-phosphate dehydrogenase [Candidatus Shikimatogenerans bostrichidophilus]